MFLICIYCSPNQNLGEFQIFCINFDSLLNNTTDEFSICSVVTGDFSAHNSRWWENDTTNLPGLELGSLASSAGYKQIIDKPTHDVNNSISCIDLIFCTSKNVIFDKCHHDITYGKINIGVPFPPIYVRVACNYSMPNVENIKKVISNFNWNEDFENLSIGKNVALLNETVLNIFRNYIANP